MAKSDDDILMGDPIALTTDREVAPDAGAAAVDTFATEYLEDAALDATADFAKSGLAADLDGDPAPPVSEFESPMRELDARAPDEFAVVDQDDGFDG